MPQDHERSAAAHDAIGRLLRLAGPRQAISEDRSRRVRIAVHDVWRETVRARVVRRRVTLGGWSAALAAAALTLAVALRPHGGGSVVSPDIAARVSNVVGTATLTNGPLAALGSGDVITAGSSVQTGAAAFATLALAGGGELRVDRQSSVRLVDGRVVSLERGAIYVDSGDVGRHDAITVRTPLGIVRDIGTRFEVRLLEGAVRVRVRAGAVRYEQGGVQRDAGAGQELRVGSGGSIETRAIATHGPDWGWTVHAAPVFRVEGRTLGEFLEWVEREHGREVRFRDAADERAASGALLHGTIDGLTADEALSAILPACGLTYRIEEGRVIVLRPQLKGID